MPYVAFRKNLDYYGEELLAPRSSSQAAGPPIVGCPQPLIQYIGSYPPLKQIPDM